MALKWSPRDVFEAAAVPAAIAAVVMLVVGARIGSRAAADSRTEVLAL
jgi:hypothetical protein